MDRKSYEDLQTIAKSLNHHLNMGYENIECFLIYLNQSGLFRKEERNHLLYYGIPITRMISEYSGEIYDIVTYKTANGLYSGELALEVLKSSIQKGGLFSVPAV